MKGKITIETNIRERDLIESCLNAVCSKMPYNNELVLGFTALAEGWHYDKLLYYLNLINETGGK